MGGHSNAGTLEFALGCGTFLDEHELALIFQLKKIRIKRIFWENFEHFFFCPYFPLTMSSFFSM